MAPAPADGPVARYAARLRRGGTLPVALLATAGVAVVLALVESGTGPFGVARRGLEVLLILVALIGVAIQVVEHRPGRERAGWMAMGGALLAALVTTVMLVADPDEAVRVGDVSQLDGAALLVVPLVIVGLALFAAQLGDRRHAARIALDAVAVGVSTAIVTWSLVLQPFVDAGDLPGNSVGMTVAYLSVDMIALAAGGIALAHARPHMRGTVAWIVLGLVLLLASDLARGIALRSDGDAGTWVGDVCWAVSLVAVAMGAWRRTIDAGEQPRVEASRLVSAWLTMPYLFLMPVAAVLLVAALRDAIDRATVIGSAVLIGALGFRHVLALHENVALTRRLAASVRALEHRADHDDLTGLLNRRGLIDRIDRMGADLRQRRPAALLFVDVDRFKGINDTLGHAVGDAVLRAIGGRLQQSLGGDGVAARFAGDEFVLLFPGMAAEHDALRRAQLAVELVERPIALGDGGEVVVTASVGVALTDALEDAEAIVREADLAMFEAKQRGRARVQLFEESLRERSRDRLRIEQDLRRALVADDEVEVHLQPILGLRDRRLHGAEALVRWRHPELGMLSPGRFLSVAEESGLIVALGRRILAEACAAAAAVPGLIVSVNLSPRQIHDPGLVRMVAEQLDLHGLPPQRLCLEVVEDVLVDERTIGVLADLQQIGTRVAIDDFGLGASSLRQLRRIPGATVKVDRSFTERLDGPEGGDDAVMVRALVAVAEQLGLAVVGEGIEREGQVMALLDLGVPFGQGWHLGMPVRAAAFVTEHGGAPLVRRVAPPGPGDAEVTRTD
ncbi:MAG: putative bifunctional diguanylate cyclase/phosphodiesterase [Solirubrobacteraceae bacterium]